ncbi:DUF2141 domain-containing protein [Pseudohalioglobus sediminis]|uniref:DUF2141 domain-containing protein n=1 Tax=Pseudohalioglobus sediminis TaxID=2606449 RepID=A0A5B0X2F6_9GAMM|nr:DUF2141 domain-containing protein [Pseudohalioglobus sediminis]KAA1193392.1 DUF2141 domain-containing protein [Pseudohalioglobus sediminis]
MKLYRWVAVLLLLVGINAAAQSVLRVEVSGLNDVSGELHISVYDNEEAWLGDDKAAALAVDIDAAREGELVIAELLLAPGDYAVSIFYDKNGNGKLDTNFIGIPKEPVALSNNAKPSFGPPKYEDALFTLTEAGLTQQIAIESI